MAEETNTQVKSTNKAKVWASIVIGALLVLAGGFGVFQSEDVNNTFIKLGAEQSAIGVIELYPDTETAIGITADVIDSAVQAREASPKQLAVLITDALNKAGVQGSLIEPIVEMVLNQLNQAYAKSDTEEIYLQKAKAVAEGIRAAIPVKG